MTCGCGIAYGFGISSGVWSKLGMSIAGFLFNAPSFLERNPVEKPWLAPLDDVGLLVSAFGGHRFLGF